MAALWARAAPVACIHPGWAALTGRAAVMESWRAILASTSRPAIASRAAKAYVYGEVAVVICYETVGGEGYLVATNVFIREDGDWRLVHHQAGPTTRPKPGTDERPSEVVH